jgi:cupin fold WbuC family metalloprotein
VITILQPDMYLKPHRHGQRATEGYEFITVLKGKLGVLLFYQEGGIVQILRSGTSGPLRSVEIPNGVYHSLVALSPNTTLLEVSTGKTEKSTRVLTNFPEPLSPEAETLLKRWHNYFRTPVNPKIRR